MNKKVSKGISIGRTSSVPNRLHDSFKKLRPDRSTRRFLDQLQDGSIDIHALEQEAADLVNRLCFGSPLPPDSPTLTAMRIQETASDAHTLQMILNGDISDLAILPEALLSRNSIILPSGYTQAAASKHGYGAGYLSQAMRDRRSTRTLASTQLSTSTN